MEEDAETRRAALHLALLWRLAMGEARCVQASPVLLFPLGSNRGGGRTEQGGNHCSLNSPYQFFSATSGVFSLKSQLIQDEVIHH
jgi:hypothetical protein